MFIQDAAIGELATILRSFVVQLISMPCADKQVRTAKLVPITDCLDSIPVWLPLKVRRRETALSFSAQSRLLYFESTNIKNGSNAWGCLSEFLLPFRDA
jgi:hypothetical protein